MVPIFCPFPPSHVFWQTRLAESCVEDAHTPTHTISISLFSRTKISGELNQRADSEMPLSRAGGNAPERLSDLLRGEAEAKSPTLIRKSCAGSWVQQRALNLRAVSLRLLQHPGSMWRRDLSSHQHSQHPCLTLCVYMCLNMYTSIRQCSNLHMVFVKYICMYLCLLAYIYACVFGLCVYTQRTLTQRCTMTGFTMWKYVQCERQSPILHACHTPVLCAFNTPCNIKSDKVAKDVMGWTDGPNKQRAFTQEAAVCVSCETRSQR